jgi:hypothetical protein
MENHSASMYGSCAGSDGMNFDAMTKEHCISCVTANDQSEADMQANLSSQIENKKILKLYLKLRSGNMNFNFDGKDYNSDDLSDKGKACLNKLQDLGIKKQQLSLEFADCEVLQKHYSELLKQELPKEEEKQASKK